MATTTLIRLNEPLIEKTLNYLEWPRQSPRLRHLNRLFHGYIRKVPRESASRIVKRRASAENAPQTSANLFAETAVYYEMPFADPMARHDAIFHYWDRGAQTLQDKQSTFEILSVQAQRGIARWRAPFAVIAIGKRHKPDCLFVVEFNADGLCQTFREWWHIKES